MSAAALWLALAALLALAGPAAAEEEDEWPEIPAAELRLQHIEEDPEADAVILLKERRGRILRRADDYVNVLSHHFRMKILTEAGKRYGEVVIPASGSSRVTGIRGRTVRPDGAVVPLPEDRIFERVLSTTGSHRVSEWVFSFPAVEPGVIIEYSYDQHDDHLLNILPFYFEGPEHTLVARVTQGVPGSMSYSILCEKCPAGVEPKVSRWKEGTVRGRFIEIELTGLPPYREELLMPPRRDASARLEMVLLRWRGRAFSGLGRQDDVFIDWNSVARYVGTYYDRAIDRGLTWLKPHVKRWTEGLTGREEKIEAVVRHIQRDFRHRDSPGIVGRVNSIQRILESRTVDAEDSAMLLVAALKFLRVDAHPALAAGRDYGAVNPGFFSLTQFSHVMVALPREDGSLRWIDPSLRYAPVGFSSWRNSGITALLIRGRKGELVELPGKAERSLTKLLVEITPLDAGDAALRVKAVFQGDDAFRARSLWAPMARAAREESLRRWIGGAGPAAGVMAAPGKPGPGWAGSAHAGLELVSHEFDGLEEPAEPLALRMSLRASRIFSHADEVVLGPACALTGLSSNPVPDGPRVHPLYVDRGWNIQETVIIHPPRGMRAVEMPGSMAVKSAVVNMSMACFEQPDGGARCRRTFVAPRGRWEPVEIDTLRTVLDKVVEADRGRVVFRKAPSPGLRADGRSGAGS